MVAPLILIIVIGGGIFLTLFTPLGDPIANLIPDSPQLDIDNIKEETENKASDSLGVEEGLNNFFDGVAHFIKDSTDIESLNLPNEPTNEELDDLIDNSAGIGKASGGLYFALKRTIESLVDITSPFQISVVIVGIVSSIVVIFLMFGLSRKILHHLLWFLVIMVAIMLILMVFGSDIQI